MFNLIQLPYSPEALEPVISSKTIAYHYGKHLQTYINNLNALIENTEWADKSLEEIVAVADGALFNNAGQVLNHNLYFSQFRAPQENNLPTGAIAAAIEKQFGSFDAFREEFQKQGVSLFGSGWVWLSEDEKGGLHITQEPNAGNPIRRGWTPLLTFDVWEHAYYLDYQNRRADHLKSLFSLINWQVIDSRLRK